MNLLYGLPALLLIALNADLGGGFLLDGLNLQLVPRGVRNTMEAMDLVFLRVYSRMNGWKGRFIGPRDTPSRMHAVGWNPELPTILLVHGFSESPETGCVPIILEAFRMTSRDVNVVVLDWSALAAGPWYYTAYNNANYVAFSMSRALDFLVTLGGASPEDLHLVGCGLGARVTARAAANVTMRGKIGRITGLDPWFGRTRSDREMATRVARFVDIMHTDGGVHGHSTTVGHADFYPNGGVSPQPGCELGTVFRGTNMFSTALCSHVRSYHYFAETIRNPYSFMAIPCNNWVDYRDGRCRTTNIAVPMGLDTPITTRGKYYLDMRRPRSLNKPLSNPPDLTALRVSVPLRDNSAPLRDNSAPLRDNSAPLRDNSALHVVQPPNLQMPPVTLQAPHHDPHEQPIKSDVQNGFQPIYNNVTPEMISPYQQQRIKMDNQNMKSGMDKKESLLVKNGMREARLWSHPGVNTLASFVRLAELNVL